MISITIITLIVAISLPSIHISKMIVARITSIALLFACLLSFNTLYIETLNSGLGLFSGLYQVSSITQSIEAFIYLIGALILIPWFIVLSKLPTEGQGTAKAQVNAVNSISNSTVLTAAPALTSSSATNNVHIGSEVQYLISVQEANIKTGPVLSEYSLVILFSVLGASLLVCSSDLISMYLSIELQSFAVYILATIHRDSETATNAGLKYFLLGGLSSCFILLGAALVYAYTGLTNLESIFNLLLVVNSNFYDSIYMTESIIPVLGILFIVMGFLFKIAAAPLHNWAPDVYDEVPSIVTTWLTIMPKISIIIFLLSLSTSALLGTNTLNPSDSLLSDITLLFPLKNVLLISSLLSLIIGSVVGLSQYKIKRLLAYSTISHVGFLLLALAINTEQSTEALLFYLIQYSITNLNTFLILLAFGYTLKAYIMRKYTNSNSLDISYIAELKGQFVSNPLLSISLAMCLFSMAGIPPLIGFFAKQQVLYAATFSGYYFMTIVGILVSVISASYYLQMIKVLHFSTNPNFVEDVQNKEVVTDLYNNSNISNSHSMLISTLTLAITLFILNPNLILNSTHLLALTIFLN